MGAVGIYILQVEMTGFTCGTMMRTKTIEIRDASCYCPTVVVDVVSSTGQTWMDRNMGASRAATSSDDFLAFGCLFQWGRANDGHANMDWTSATAGTLVNGTTTTLSGTDDPGHDMNIITAGNTTGDWRSPRNSNLWQGEQGVNNPCPAGYRVPTRPEYQAEMNAGLLANTTIAFQSVLKMPAPGVLFGNGVHEYSNIYLWTSTVLSVPSYTALLKVTSSSDIYVTGARGNAATVRCIKD